MERKPQVIVTTERRGVFYGTLESYDEDKRVAVLSNAVMAIYWGTTKGLFELAATGPTDKSRISSPVERIRVELCECWIEVSAPAAEAWRQFAS